MNWDQLAKVIDEWGPIIVAIAALVIVAGLLHKAWPFLSRLILVVNASVTLPEELAKLNASVTSITADVGHIKHEVQTNSGSSLKDSVTDIQRTSRATAASVRRMDKRLVAVEAGQLVAARLAATSPLT